MTLGMLVPDLSCLGTGDFLPSQRVGGRAVSGEGWRA